MASKMAEADKGPLSSASYSIVTSRGVGPCVHQRRGVTRDRDIRAQSDLNYVLTKQYTSLNFPFTRSQIAMCENAKALA